MSINLNNGPGLAGCAECGGRPPNVQWILGKNSLGWERFYCAPCYFDIASEVEDDAAIEATLARQDENCN